MNDLLEGVKDAEIDSFALCVCSLSMNFFLSGYANLRWNGGRTIQECPEGHPIEDKPSRILI